MSFSGGGCGHGMGCECQEQFERTCKKCKQDRPGQDFVGARGNYTSWCKACREERWRYLKSLKPKTVKAPTFDRVLHIAYEAVWFATGDRKRELWEELTQLQEEWKWTAVSKF